MDKAVSRVQQLRNEGKTGSEIAKVLLVERFTIKEANEAFFQEGYVSSIQPFTSDIPELHVSDEPMGASFATSIMSLDPQALPSVVWHKRE